MRSRGSYVLLYGPGQRAVRRVICEISEVARTSVHVTQADQGGAGYVCHADASPFTSKDSKEGNIQVLKLIPSRSLGLIHRGIVLVDQDHDLQIYKVRIMAAYDNIQRVHLGRRKVQQTRIIYAQINKYTPFSTYSTGS